MSSLIYNGLNTFTANDDLFYSFCEGMSKRATAVKQIIKEQISQYSWMNGRIIVHCVVQFVLMYGRKLFAVINGLVITATVLINAIIATKYMNAKKDYAKILILCMINFLSLFSFYHMIYWAAGSVNYVWLYMFVELVFLIYLKTDFNNNHGFNWCIFFLLANLHENTLVVATILYVSIVVKEIYNKVKEKRINIYKLAYIIPIVLGGLILLSSPGMTSRASNYPEWYSMNVIERLLKSMPELSKVTLELNNIQNLIPVTYIISTIAYLIKWIVGSKKLNVFEKIKDNKINFISLILIIMASLFVYLYNNKWVSFGLIIVFAFIENYIHYINKEYKLIVISISMYAVVFSMCITPIYTSLRPNYYLYMYYGMLSSLYIVRIIGNYDKIFYGVSSAILIVLIVISSNIYYNIGKVVKVREKEIADGLSNGEKVIYLTRIENKYAKYHFDSNDIGNSDYFFKDKFWKYYNIPSDVVLIVKEK